MITNLVNLGNFEATSTSPLEGTYDSAAKTITINTPEYDSERAVSDYTHYGDVSYFGYDCSIVLFAGEFSTKPDKNGQYALETTDKLVFDVSDDLSTITPRTGFGLWVFDKKTASSFGCVKFYQGGTVGIEKMPDEAKLAFVPSSVHFEGPNVTVGTILKRSIRLVNKGLKATDYTGRVDGDDLKLAVYQSIDAGSVQEVYIELNGNDKREICTQAERNIAFLDNSAIIGSITHWLALKPGSYVLQFQNITNNDWAEDADVRYRAYIYDMVFRLYDQQEHLAVLKQDALDFGNHFFDRLSVRDTLTATLMNLGTEPLSLTHQST